MLYLNMCGCPYIQWVTYEGSGVELMASRTLLFSLASTWPKEKWIWMHGGVTWDQFCAGRRAMQGPRALSKLTSG